MENAQTDGGVGSEDVRLLRRVKQLIKEEDFRVGRVQSLTCRRDTRVVSTDPRAYLATFDFARLAHPACVKEESEGSTFLSSFHFVDVPVVRPEREECGQSVALCSNIQEGDVVEIQLLSSYTCILKKMSPSAVELHLKELTHVKRIQECANTHDRAKINLLKGNREFKLGLYQKAHECYTRAIRYSDIKSKSSSTGKSSPLMSSKGEVDALDLVKCYANDALALLHLNQELELAYSQCNNALRLVEDLLAGTVVDNKAAAAEEGGLLSLARAWRVKGLLRRAEIRRKLERPSLEDSLRDVEEVLVIQPKNRDAQHLKESILKAAKEAALLQEEKGEGDDDDKKTLLKEREVLEYLKKNEHLFPNKLLDERALSYFLENK